MYLTKKFVWREPTKKLPTTGITGVLKEGKETGAVVLELKFDDDAIAACDIAYGLDTLTLLMLPDPEGLKITAKKKWTMTIADYHVLPADMVRSIAGSVSIPIVGKLNAKTKKIQLVW